MVEGELAVGLDRRCGGGMFSRVGESVQSRYRNSVGR